MFQGYLSTLFFIFTLLGLSLVTLSVIFGRLGLWMGMGLLTVLLLRWLRYEFKMSSINGKELNANLLNQKLGWYQKVARYHLIADPLSEIQIRFYSMRKPDILINRDLFFRMSQQSLNVTLLYFCELARSIDSNRWLKFWIILCSLLGINLIPYLHKTKELALDHLQNWHGLDSIVVKVRLQQAQYFWGPPTSQSQVEYFKSFPNSLPKGASV
jgi:hypothetical protein